MDLHQRQQFDLFLAQAAESFIDRIVQRCAGQQAAYEALQQDANAEGVWLDEFVDAVFADWCLDNAEGAAFVLCALQSRPGNQPIGGATIRDSLVATAKLAFGDLLHQKVLESMSRASVYG